VREYSLSIVRVLNTLTASACRKVGTDPRAVLDVLYVRCAPHRLTHRAVRWRMRRRGGFGRQPAALPQAPSHPLAASDLADGAHGT
jgi:hypothetical protein